jgi:leader peptidase (prepilin peptidase) / N-methyltransferase
VTPLAIVLAIAGAAWGAVADRIAARWPAHEDGSIRRLDWRTPVAIAAGALALGAVTLRFAEPVEQLVFGVYLVVLVLLLAIDLDQRLLPDELTLPAIPLALLFALTGLNPLVPNTLGWLAMTAVAALLIPGLIYAFSIPFGAGAFGLGDVKLLVSVGLLVGPMRLFTGVVYGVFLAGVVIVILLALRRITLRSYVPFGPFLVIGAFWAILVAT